VKRSAKRDTRQWIDEQTERAEQATLKGDAKQLYGVTQDALKQGFNRN
jgi:hypothetical protein